MLLLLQVVFALLTTAAAIMCVSMKTGALCVPVLMDISFLPMELFVKVCVGCLDLTFQFHYGGNCPLRYHAYENKSYYLSLDLDECAQPFSPCMHHCTNTVGSYYCHCRDGFKLHGNSACLATGNDVFIQIQVSVFNMWWSFYLLLFSSTSANLMLF